MRRERSGTDDSELVARQRSRGWLSNCLTRRRPKRRTRITLPSPAEPPDLHLHLSLGGVDSLSRHPYCAVCRRIRAPVWDAKGAGSMSRAYSSFGAKVVVLSALLLSASSANAQSTIRTMPAFRIHPADKGFQATMSIQSYYQDVVHAAPAVASRPIVRAPVHAESTAAPVTVSIAEPPERPQTVTIRSPSGDVRSFPIAPGRNVIRARTIVLRPGEKLTLVIGTAQAQAGKK